MKYISNEYALNIPCSLKTSGDWHYNSYPVEKAKLFDSNESYFGDFGIEEHVINNKTYFVANHLRAILDLMFCKKFDFLKGFKDDFIVVDDYNSMFFDKVYELRNLDMWDEVNFLMKEEFMIEWLDYIDQKEGNNSLQVNMKETYTTNMTDTSVAGINKLFVAKIIAGLQNSSIRDYYDICFIYNKYKEKLDGEYLALLANVLNQKGETYFKYLARDQGVKTAIDIVEFEKLYKNMLNDFYKE